MKKLFVLVVLVELSILFIVSFSTSYAVSIPRHKNPAQIQEEAFFPVQLISLYGKIVNLQISEEWSSASSELIRTYLSYIPESVRYIFIRFNQLIQAMGDKLKIVKENIDSAEALLDYGEVEEAGKKLEEAWETVLKAERDLDRLNSSVDELKRRIGSAAAERLRKEIAPLGKLAEGYKNRIQNLYHQVKEGKRLESTFLQIFVGERKVVVGSSFEVSGRLKIEDEKFLATREIDIFLEKERIFKVVTDKDGEFKANIDFPFLYKKAVQVFASFTPQKEDKEKFYPSTSNKILLEPVFYTPLIKASYQEPVYPLLPFKVQGEVRLEDAALVNYPVKMKLAQKIIEITTNEKGKFQTQLLLPAEVDKIFPLSIFTPPRGIIGPASLTTNISVTYKIPSMMVNLPLVIVPPFPSEVKGEVDLKGQPMRDAIVRVIAEKEDVKTFVRGKNFKVKLNIPLYRFSGWERITILLHPQEAWISSLNQKEKVLVVNPLTLLPFFALLALFIGVSRKKEKEIGEAEGVSEESKKAAPEEKVDRKELVPIVKIYTKAVKLVGEFTEIKIAAEYTIREYLSLVKKPLGKGYNDFEFISFITEKFLYGSKGISEKELAEAEKRLDRLVS